MAGQETPHERDTMRGSNMSRYFGKERSSQFDQIFSTQRYSSRDKATSASRAKVEIPRVRRSKKEFPTGSSYIGEWDIFGMSGKGRYTFPYGVVYEGEFMEGMFHGKGEMIYSSGISLKGTWDRGELKEHTVVFADKIEYTTKDWKYCTIPDRRFSVEYQKGLQPAGRAFKTNEQPTMEIPKGCYDTVDGFYDPITRAVYKKDKSMTILRVPLKHERDWIEANCRKEWDEVVGPRPDLYEKWYDPEEQGLRNQGLSGKAFSFGPCKAFRVGDNVENPCPCNPCESTELLRSNIQTSRAYSEPDDKSAIRDNRDKSVEQQALPLRVTTQLSTITECVCEVETKESKFGQKTAWQKIVDSKSGELFRNVMHGAISSLEEEEKRASLKQKLERKDYVTCKLCSQEDKNSRK